MTDTPDITQIGIDHFIELVSLTGTECLKKGKEDYMGEARERMKMGLAPRIMKPGEQIQIGPEVMKHAVPRECKCGCKYFIPVVQVASISALISPIGQELTTQLPVLICLKCQEPLKLKEEAVEDSEPEKGGEAI